MTSKCVLGTKNDYWGNMMSFYNFIQRILFNTYEEWYMKSPLSNHHGFHIVGIDNSLKAMRDGYMMYTEIRPPQAIKGCTAMKAVVGRSDDLVDLYLKIDGKTYCISDLSYDETGQMMRLFVKKSLLPEGQTYTEVLDSDNEKLQTAFAELSELLIRDEKYTKIFLKKVQPKTIEAIEKAWYTLYEVLLYKKKAVELDWKTEKEDFIFALKKLDTDLTLEIDEASLDENEGIYKWSEVVNTLWTDHVLTAMDIDSDSYVLMILTKEDFERAKTLARTILHRIAPAEEM